MIPEQNSPQNGSKNNRSDSKITVTIDLEDLFRHGKPHPKHDPGVVILYRIKIDENYHNVNERDLTGKAILALEGKEPKSFQLQQSREFKGKIKIIDIEADEVVDFTTPGIEKFITKPKSHVYQFSIDKKEYQTEHAQLTVRQILVDFAQVDPSNKTLAVKKSGGFHEYKDLNEVIDLKNNQHFTLFDNTPTTVSHEHWN